MLNPVRQTEFILKKPLTSVSILDVWGPPMSWGQWGPHLHHCEQYMNNSYICNIPAMQAVRKQVALPAMKARNATSVIVFFRLGANVVSVPIAIPTEPGLENPQRAYVAIISDRGCN